MGHGLDQLFPEQPQKRGLKVGLLLSNFLAFFKRTFKEEGDLGRRAMNCQSVCCWRFSMVVSLKTKRSAAVVCQVVAVKQRAVSSDGEPCGIMEFHRHCHTTVQSSHLEGLL